ncbi:DUF6612 family protein [Jeotgalibacillus sp. R-1-5s-1]|uniref:DUF6612 family protein n=1 Tax=Jeotgalibacillus sp. R-1-5s-1 TaxID=2555897 RepID=UPI00106A7715|nr:DUF6612 family protein [Jeotgalibacillus sp. R-1-5s-1]TFD98151.1 hypothetical protein E2491_08570 [Jeotgalibacillus sp. R-1-5s-1]
MKKWPIYAASASLALLLAACSDSAEPTEGTEEASDMTLQEVFEKSIEASNDISSLKSTMNIDQTMTISGEDMTFNTISNSDVEMTADPLAMYQVTTTSMSGEGAEEAMLPETEMESYITQDGFFMYDPASEQWMKFPQEMSDQFLQMSEQQSDPAAQIEALEPFMDDFTFEQNDSSYILTLNASGEKFSEFLIDQAGEMMPDMGMGMSVEELFETTTFEDVKYEIVISKDDYLMESLVLDMTMNMDMEGETMSIKQHLESDYTEYNTVDEITVPQEVLDNAVEMEM